MDSEFKLLYLIETLGLDGLDGVTSKFREINLATKYGEGALREFQNVVKDFTTKGTSYRDALELMRSNTTAYGQTVASVARDVLKNDAAQRASLEETARVAQRAADERARAANMVAREVEAAVAKEQASLARLEEQQIASQRRTAGGVARGIGVPGGFALSGGSAAVAGGFAIGAAAAGLLSITKEATDSARALQNLADEFGITINQAFQFQAAARLAGVEVGTMSQALRRLSEADQDPEGAGKKTAEAMTKLGVNIHQAAGPALIEVIHRLNELTDVNQKAAEATDILGRGFISVLNAGKQFDSVGVTWDNNVTKKLLDAQRVLADFENQWIIAKAELAAGVVIPIMMSLRTIAGGTTTEQNVTGAKSVFGTIAATIGGPLTMGLESMDIVRSATAANMALKPPVPPGVANGFGPLDFSRANQALANSSKLSLDEQSQAKKREYDAAVDELRRMKAVSKPSKEAQDAIDAETTKVNKLRTEYERLEAAKKSAARAESLAQSWPGVLGQWSDRVNALIANEKGPVARLDEDYQKVVRERSLKPFSPEWTALTVPYGILRDAALKDQRDKTSKDALKDSEMFSGIDNTANLTAAKFYTNLMNTGMREGDAMTEVAFGKLPYAAVPSEGIGFSDAQNAALGRVGYAGQARIRSTLGGPGQEGIADRTNLDIKLQEIAVEKEAAILHAQERNDAKTATDIENARFEAKKAQYEAELQYEEKLATIKKQQLDETRAFTSGLFQAALSGRPDAVGSFMRSWATGMASKIVGNAGAEVLGTFNQHLSLQRDLTKPGLLGAADDKGEFQPNFFGKILGGSPFGVDPSKALHDPLKIATEANTEATVENTKALLAWDKSRGSGGSGSGTVPTSKSPSSIPNLLAPLAPFAQRGSGNASGATAENVATSARPSILQRPASMPSTMSFGGGSDSTAAPPFVPSLTDVSPVDTSPNSAYDLISQMNLPGAPAFGGSSIGNAYTDASSSGFPASPGNTLPGLNGASDPNAYADASSFPLPSPGMELPGFGGSGSGGGNAYGDTSGFPLLSSGMGLPGFAGGASDATDASNPANFPLPSNQMGLPGNIAIPAGVDRTGDVKAGTGFASKISGLLSGGQIASSGYGAEDIWAKISDPNSTNITGLQAVGAGIGMAGQAAGGVMQSISGFEKGGARGDIQGVAGAATAIAPFTGPAAPFIEGGAALLDLVSALFPDPRQQRQKEETQTLLSRAFIEPAAHNYSFGSSGGGVSSTEGGAVSTGGDITHNHQYFISATDAKSFYDQMVQNPGLLANAIEMGITQGGSAALGSVISYVSQNGSI